MQLKTLAGLTDSEDDSDDSRELDELEADAAIPIDELIAEYEARELSEMGTSAPTAAKFKEEAKEEEDGVAAAESREASNVLTTASLLSVDFEDDASTTTDSENGDSLLISRSRENEDDDTAHSGSLCAGKETTSRPMPALRRSKRTRSSDSDFEGDDKLVGFQGTPRLGLRRRQRSITGRCRPASPEEEGVGISSGSTAVVLVITAAENDVLVATVANAGDSRCVLCRGNVAKDLSFDHKPEDPAETERITAAGAVIDSDGRVNGGLNLSRALGDHRCSYTNSHATSV